MNQLQILLADGSDAVVSSFDAVQCTVQVKGHALKAESCVFQIGEISKGQRRQGARMARNYARGVHMKSKSKKTEGKPKGAKKVQAPKEEPTTGMSIKGAAAALSNGKVVRRASWDDTAQPLIKDRDGNIGYTPGEDGEFGLTLTPEDLLADDWEIVEQPKVQDSERGQTAQAGPAQKPPQRSRNRPRTVHWSRPRRTRRKTKKRAIRPSIRLSGELEEATLPTPRPLDENLEMMRMKVKLKMLTVGLAVGLPVGALLEAYVLGGIQQWACWTLGAICLAGAAAINYGTQDEAE
jgi:hypothetical protein